MDSYHPVQYFENEDLTIGSGANIVAVKNDFYIFKSWQEIHDQDATPFFTENKSAKTIYIEDKTTHTKMPKKGY